VSWGGVAYHALQLVQHAPGEEQANGVSCDQAAERVADNAELGYVSALALDQLQLLLDLNAHALAAEFNAIVCEGAAVTLCDQDVELIGRVLVSQGFGHGPHVVRVAPELPWHVVVLADGADIGTIGVLVRETRDTTELTPWTNTQRCSAPTSPPAYSMFAMTFRTGNVISREISAMVRSSPVRLF
jgi:hypothetical protein